jgi:biopolymer transport protein TolR
LHFTYNRRGPVLTLTADGGFALTEEPVPANALASALAQIYAQRPAKVLFIRASAERSYQDVVTAMDVARGAGVQVLALMPGPVSR